MKLSPIPELIEALRAGQMIVLADDEDRENEGDLIMAAECVTPEAINFMAKFGRGLICITLPEAHCRQLNLPLMVSQNGSSHGTNFTVSIEAATGVSTGISAADRAHTIRTAVARHAKADDLVQPGHVFPLMAAAGGVLVRAGHTEAGSDLARLAGFSATSVICEIMNDDGTMARLPDLHAFCDTHGLKMGTIAALIQYRHQTEKLIERVADRVIETVAGAFRMLAYRDASASEVHIALVKGEIQADVDTLVRVHEPLSIADLLDIGTSRHSWALLDALHAIQASPCGVALLLHRPETGEELLAKLNPLPASRAQRWDTKTFGIGAQILRDIGVGKMRVMGPSLRLASMAGFGLDVVGHQLPAAVEAAPRA